MVIGCEHGHRQMHAGVRSDDSGRASGSPQAVSRMACADRHRGSEPWVKARTCLAPPHSPMLLSNRVGSDHDERS